MLSVTHPLQLVLGLIIWALWFVVIYGGLSVACEVAPPDVSSGAYTWINGSVLLLTLLTTGFLLVLATLCRRVALRKGPGTIRFITGVAAGIYLASAVATLVIGLPVVALPPCL
jgi:hypothetical protein